MANYHIDPASGVDTNTGASWAQAWKTLNGLRVNAIVPGAGDLIKVAKSTVATRTGGSWGNSAYAGFDVVWEGQVIHRTQQTYSSTAYPSSSNYATYPLMTDYLVSGVAAQTYSEFRPKPPMRMVSTSGQFNTPSIKICHYVVNGNVAGANYKGICCQFRCTTPYTGAGDQDIPAGTFAIKLCSDTAGNVPVYTFVVNKAIRNSDDWTLFWVELGAPYGNTLIQSVSLWRTAATLNRDASVCGIEWTPPIAINSAYSYNFDGVAVHPMKALGTIGPYAFGWDANSLCVEEMLCQGQKYQYGFYSSDYIILANIREDYNSTLVKYHKAYPSTPVGGGWDLEYVGSAAWPLAASNSKGAFDLNGSAGGAPGNPLTIRFGYNTVTDLVDGVTVYSAYRLTTAPTSCALLDLGYADHVVIENLVPVYGWGAIVARPGILTLKACHLPWAFRSPFMDATASSNITLESMIISMSRLEYLGAFAGDLTLRKCWAPARADTVSPNRYFEVGKLVIDGSHLGELSHSGQKTGFKWCVRDDSVIENIVCTAPPRLVQLAWDKTLTIRNPLDNGTSQTLNYVPTAPESRWGVIDYQAASWPNGTWSTYAGTMPPSADQLLKVTSIPMAAVAYQWGWDTSMFEMSEGVGSTVVRFMHTSTKLASVSMPLKMPTYSYDSGLWYPLPYVYRYIAGSVNAYGDVYDRMVKTPASGNNVVVYIHHEQSNITYRKSLGVYPALLGIPSAIPSKATPPLFVIFCQKDTAYMLHIGVMCKNIFYNAGTVTDPAVGSAVYYGEGNNLAYIGYQVGLSADGLPQDILQAYQRPANSGTWNSGLDMWEDVYIPFTLTEDCFVTVRWYAQNDRLAIFDTVEVYAQ